jgi:2'-5' RNA ligase
VRLFIAVRLSPELRALIARETAALRAAVPDVRWTGEEALHVTLRFLGEVTGEDAAAIQSVLDACASAHEPFTLGITGLGAFPRMARAQVLWLGVEDGGATTRIVQCLDRALVKLGFTPDERGFTPHVTLGRARSRKGIRIRARDGTSGLTLDGTMRVDRIELIRSHLGSGPAGHEVLHTALLGGGTE